MERNSLEPVEELRQVVSHLKKLMTYDRDMGLEPPILSSSTLEYLRKEASSFNPPEVDKGLIPRPLGRLRWFPIDTPLLAAGKFIPRGPQKGFMQKGALLRITNQ